MQAREVRDAGEWDALVADHPFGHPLQCWGWGEIKQATGWTAERIAVFDGDGFRAGAQVLTRALPGSRLSMTYVPRGPICAPEDSAALVELAESLHRHGRTHHSIFCKLDPAWEVGSRGASSLLQAGLRPSAESIQVTDTYTIDLRQSEDAVLAAMRSKTRQYIRRAEREETTIVRDTSGELLDACYEIYRQTSRRAHFGLHPRAYYEHLFRLYSPQRQYLYVALRRGAPLSFLWMVCAGRHAVEFYGGVSDVGQEWKSNYLLKWHAIRQMRAAGYEVYDLNGRVNEGISQFKQGFGPVETSWIGPYDAVYHPLFYAAWSRGLPLVRRLASRRG